MKLMTKTIEEQLRKHPLHSTRSGEDSEVIVKYFNPYGAGTWLITEGSREGDDWCLFGYCHIFEWEWGYVMLSELERLHPLGGIPVGVERDMYLPEGTTVRQAINN